MTTLLVETLNQFLNTKFPLVITAFTACALVWIVNSGGERLDRIEHSIIPEAQREIQFLNVEREKSHKDIDQLERDREVMKQDIREMKADIAEIKADIRVIMSKLK